VKRIIILSITGICLAGCSKWNGRDNQGAVSGTIETDESHLASRYGGRVEAILAREGDILKPGQVLIRLEASELEARYAQARATLNELKAGPRKEEIQAAKNDWEAAVADFEFAKIEAKRLSDSFEHRTVSASERDRAVSRSESLAKTAAAAKSRYDLLLAGTRPERIQLAEAQLKEIETQLHEMEIVAPTNSVLEVLQVKAGDVPGPNQPVATLLLMNHLWVRVFVPEPWLGLLKLGEKVRVRVDSFPDKAFTGEVEQIARSAEFTPRNVQTVGERVKQVFGVKIRLPTDTGELRAGMSADVTFPNTPKED
jgi:HlyD family secretion protein